MDPAEILTVRFHFGGEFVHIGKELDYVGGDEAISEIERDNTTGGDGVSERSHGSQGINEAIFFTSW
jgi:hypothetical protein